MRMTNNQKILNDSQKQEWLELYCTGGITIADTCQDLGISLRKVARWQKEDLDFLKQVEMVRRYNHKTWPCSTGQKFGQTGTEEEKKQRKNDIIARRVEKNKENTRKLQAAWLKAYDKLSFNISEVCRACDINRSRFRDWEMNDEEFAQAYKDAKEAKKDFIENKLMENIANGDTQSIIFACKTQLKDRGYVEKQQVEHSGNSGVMLSPGTAPDPEEWEKIARAQQIALSEKINQKDDNKPKGKPKQH
jgi:transposase-like protein